MRTGNLKKDNKPFIAQNVFEGTQDEWDALSEDEKVLFDVVYIYKA